MSAVSLLVHLVFKTFFLALPICVAWLAFRRLSLSESHNAWLYSGVGLFATVAALGLAPWALGFAGASWILLLLALACPLLWIATVMICDLKERSYGDEEPMEWVAEKFHSRRAAQTSQPLVLSNAVSEEAPAPLFRHRRPDVEPPLQRPIAERPIAERPAKPSTPPVDLAAFIAPKPAPAAAPIIETRDDVEKPRADTPRRVLDVARDMRGDGARHLRKDLVDADGRERSFLSGTA